MASAAARVDGWNPDRSAAGPYSPWLLVGIISIPTFMEVLDTSIANVSLDHIAGGLSISTDQATWVLTSYLVANAIVIPISGWLSDAIGRKRYFLISIALFTLSSLMCGLAPNLTTLVIARVFQGIGGGGLAPVEQSMLADTFPPRQRGMAFAAFAIVVVVGPVFGPTLGGFITEAASWHWIFLINVPIGIASFFLANLIVDEPKAIRDDRAKLLKRGLRIDYIGVALVALGLGFLEITLDRGEREDWFSSGFIVASAAIAVVSLVALVIWELQHDDPVIDLKLMKNRNFSLTLLVMGVTGMILFGTTQLIPQMLQQVLGYSAFDAGLALTAGGLATLLMVPVAGRLSGVVDVQAAAVPRPDGAGVRALEHVASDRRHLVRRCGVRPHVPGGGPAVPVRADQRDRLCRTAAEQDGAGVEPAQCRAQPGRYARHFDGADLAGVQSADPPVEPGREAQSARSEL